MESSRRGVRPAMAAALLLGAAGVLGIVIGPHRTAAWTMWGADLAREAAVEPAEATPGHLVISEVMSGGASASDEFVELYNPTAGELPLEGLELVYVSASGATITRKAAWSAGAAGLPPGAHLLVANEAGIYASVADVAYANGLAASGGSVALRVQGAGTAIDAVGWGTATSTWLEGSPAAAVAAGHALERLPGGAAGSGQDTNDNALDFFDQPAPEPQNTAAPPVGVTPSPSPTATTSSAATPEVTPDVTPTPDTSPTPMSTAPATIAPSPTATPTPTPMPTSTPTPTPTPTPSAAMSVADARALPDGTTATIEAVSLTDGAFTDGGGCVADASAGIALLVDAGTFPRGFVVRATGELDDRYHQRTLRVASADVAVLEAAAEPAPIAVTTGSVGEATECRLVTFTADVVSSATQLSGGLAFDVDDGSGPVRLVVPEGSGIDPAAWARGTQLQVRGVVGQRDSSGSGTTGYRVHLRDPLDVLGIAPPATASPTPSGSGSPSGSPLPSDSQLMTIAAAREASPNARVRVRGVVTLPSNVLGEGTAAIQDASGAIFLRLGDEAGSLSLGELVQVDGMRSTKSGMETIRVATPPLRLGNQPQPGAPRHATGTLGEAQEARLVLVRGVVATTPRRSSAQNVYFDLDDGSGPLRVYVTPGSGIDAATLTSGAWVEITGVLGQETSGQQPQRGYRLWPRRPADLAIVAPAASATAAEGGEAPAGGGAIPPRTGAGDVPGPGHGAAAPRWPSGIPAPRLGAPVDTGATVTRPPSPSLDPRATAAAARPSATTTMTLLLVLAAAVLASSAAVTAASPGLLARLRLVIGSVGHAARPPEGVSGEPATGPAVEGGRDEARGPRLVPLPIPDDPSVEVRR
jgi:hypothetical protein